MKLKGQCPPEHTALVIPTRCPRTINHLAQSIKWPLFKAKSSVVSATLRIPTEGLLCDTTCLDGTGMGTPPRPSSHPRGPPKHKAHRTILPALSFRGPPPPGLCSERTVPYLLQRSTNKLRISFKKLNWASHTHKNIIKRSQLLQTRTIKTMAVPLDSISNTVY